MIDGSLHQTSTFPLQSPAQISIAITLQITGRWMRRMCAQPCWLHVYINNGFLNTGIIFVITGHDFCVSVFLAIGCDGENSVWTNGPTVMEINGPCKESMGLSPMGHNPSSSCDKKNHVLQQNYLSLVCCVAISLSLGWRRNDKQYYCVGYHIDFIVIHTLAGINSPLSTVMDINWLFKESINL